ncbi:MAG: helix-turn-helix transcriptional regulator [Candidatus Aenigmarchaeota archaeon]|nr:helix-turn-helix transcriptional regulator [Candidatus Aenigmarchaeota archaeon]
MNLFEYVGQRIKDLRANYSEGEGVSQEALANALEVSTNTVSRWETATYRPTLEDLDKLARFFGKSILEFFPPEEAQANDQLAALLRAAKQLAPDDIDELRRYAEFRRARSLYRGGARPRPGRKKRQPT